MFATDARWWPAKDGDADAHRLVSRHYSRSKRVKWRKSPLFIGPGRKSAWVTADGLAVFVWRQFIDDCELGGGVNCAVFRNEGPHRSSDLIREADAIADREWPGERRHYTYVDPRRVRSSNPGCCFRMAGWRRCGVTKGGLLCLERVRAAGGVA